MWISRIQEKEQTLVKTHSTLTHLIKLKQFLVMHIALAFLIQEAISSGFDKYFMTFDWKSFSLSLMAAR